VAPHVPTLFIESRRHHVGGWQVFTFDVSDSLDEDGDVMTMIAALFVVRPDRRAMSTPALADLRVFEAHPESRFSIGGVLTRVSPFPSFQVLSHSLLTSASDSLRGSGDDDRFSPETLRALGLPRQ